MATANGALTSAKPKLFSFKAFGQGIVIALLGLCLLIFFLFLKTPQTIEALNIRLASQTIIIEWEQDTPAKEAHIPFSSPSLSDQQLESGLTKAPIEGLSVAALDGTRRPTIRKKDSLSPFQAYKRPFDVYASDQPLISLVITDLGLSKIATESAVRTMPPDVSFAFSPYTDMMDFWVEESRARGHEIWLTLPVESKNYPDDDPGAHTLIINAPEQENIQKLNWILSQADGYIGFLTNHESIFMKSLNDIHPVMNTIYKSGLGFVDGSDQPGMTPQTIAAGMKAPYATVDIWLDQPEASKDSIEHSLEQLEKIAHKNGFAVGIIHPLPVSYQSVLQWITTLPEKNIMLAPLSATTGY